LGCATSASTLRSRTSESIDSSASKWATTGCSTSREVRHPFSPYANRRRQNVRSTASVLRRAKNARDGRRGGWTDSGERDVAIPFLPASLPA
jgi:hypothetical protein